MFGNAMKCDVCARTEMVNTVPFGEDEWAVPTGWARVHLNETVDWRFSQSQNKRTEMKVAYDCCSLSCAYALLGEAKGSLA